jgi:hypothetical protein
MFSDSHSYTSALVKDHAAKAERTRTADRPRDRVDRGTTPAEIALEAAQAHLTMAEYTALARDVAEGSADVRVYDDGIVIMRTMALA